MIINDKFTYNIFLLIAINQLGNHHNCEMSEQLVASDIKIVLELSPVDYF